MNSGASSRQHQPFAVGAAQRAACGVQCDHEGSAFLADAAKTQIDIAPSTGEEVEAFIARVVASPPAVVERAKRAVRGN